MTVLWIICDPQFWRMAAGGGKEARIISNFLRFVRHYYESGRQEWSRFVQPTWCNQVVFASRGSFRRFNLGGSLRYYKTFLLGWTPPVKQEYFWWDVALCRSRTMLVCEILDDLLTFWISRPGVSIGWTIFLGRARRAQLCSHDEFVKYLFLLRHKLCAPDSCHKDMCQ